MRISPNAAALGALALFLGGVALIPAIGQSSPESILPPGFDEPAQPAPAPARPDSPSPRQPAPGTPAPAATVPPASGVAAPGDEPLGNSVAAEGAVPPEPVDLAAYELPEFAKRPLSAVGPVRDTISGAAFGDAGGRTVERLMRRLDAPLPSRWLSIALRRALTAQITTPRDVNGADLAAERAWLLLRMGEANAARAMVQSVDVEDYTPKLFQVAMQAMLANGDPAGLCPLVEPASRVSVDRGWRFARAMCSGLAGKPTEAGSQLIAARKGMGRSIDALLAEKVVGAGAQGRRAVTIEWQGVERLNAWRIGLATATGVEIPDTLLAAVRPQVALWRATAPMVPLQARVALADEAAVRGVLSNAALADLYAEVEAGDDTGSAAGATARDLRAAFEGTASARLAAMKALWDAPQAERQRYARLILTARAAATLPPSSDAADQSARLVASMLAAGLDRTAQRWRGIVPAAGDGWAMLVLSNPNRIGVRYDAVDAFRSADASEDHLKARMLLAALTGLGRLPLGDAQRLAEPLGVQFGAENAWTRAMRQAAVRREPGTVLLLLAIGMQTADWRGVPPEVLFHGCAALRDVGLEADARMIAAEAIARL